MNAGVTHQLPHRLLTGAQDLDDAAAGRIGKCVKDICVHVYMHDHAYTPRAASSTSARRGHDFSTWGPPSGGPYAGRPGGVTIRPRRTHGDTHRITRRTVRTRRPEPARLDQGA